MFTVVLSILSKTNRSWKLINLSSSLRSIPLFGLYLKESSGVKYPFPEFVSLNKGYFKFNKKVFNNF